MLAKFWIALCLLCLCLSINETSIAGLSYSPTTTVSAETSNNTSASPAFTDKYYSFDTRTVTSNSNGDMVPSNISKISVRTLLSGDAAKAQIFMYTQTWFCHLASNESNGLIITPTAPDSPKCASHIDIGYNSGDSTQIAHTISDMQSRGIQGVLADWGGPPILSTSQTNVQNNDSIDQFIQQAPSGFKVAVVEDEGVAGCLKGWWPCQCETISGKKVCDQNTEAIYDINYAIKRWTPYAAYLHYNGRPVIYSFGLDSYASHAGTTMNWGEIVSHLIRDPVTGLAPLLMFENSTSHAYENGGYSWISTTPWTKYPGTDPFSLSYLNYEFTNFISATQSNSSFLTTASAFKGFDDTVVNGWGSTSVTATNDSRYVDQQCGLTWLESFKQINAKYASQPLNYIGLPTWDDYEEATELQTGIDNCLAALHPSLSGSVVSWNPVFGSSIRGYYGNESTVDHYVVFVSQDGKNLMPLPSVPSGTHSLNLSQFGLSSGTYYLFLKAVGKPMIKNTFVSVPGTYTVSTVASSSLTGLVTNASTGLPLSGATVKYSGGSTTTNSSGHYTFLNVKPATYSVTASANGYLARSVSVSVVSGATATANIPIATAGIIYGVVQSYSGNYWSNASVTITGGVVPTTVKLTSDSSGKFTTSWIPVGTYKVTCTVPYPATNTYTVNLSSGQKLYLDCKL